MKWTTDPPTEPGEYLVRTEFHQTPCAAEFCFREQDHEVVAYLEGEQHWETYAASHDMERSVLTVPELVKRLEELEESAKCHTVRTITRPVPRLDLDEEAGDG